MTGRHLILSWAMPATQAEDFAALYVVAHWLNLRFLSDTKLRAIASRTCAAVDVATPEGNLFYVFASVLPGISAKTVREKLKREFQLLASSSKETAMLPRFSRQLAKCLTVPPGRWSRNLSKTNGGQSWNLDDVHHLDLRLILAKKLSQLKFGDIQKAARNYLANSKCSVLVLRSVAL